MWQAAPAAEAPDNTAVPPASASLPWITVSPDGTHFTAGKAGPRFDCWGVNYDRDDAGRLLEEYWEQEWSTVEEDFREMKALGCKVVRIHLQTAAFLSGPDRPDEGNLKRLARLIRLAESCGLYLKVTGLGCYHKDKVPLWYSSLKETERWKVQARFWQEVAKVCRDQPAVFCYDLMNEPLVSGGEAPEDWLPGKPLGGKHYVQRITTAAAGRKETEIARDWVARLCGAIREVDSRHLITVGVIPWAQVFKGAKPLFYAPGVRGPLDFVSIHLYPRSGKLEEDIAALRVYEIGKPLVIGEFFPLSASYDETAALVEKAGAWADGWMSFYWGKTVAEYRKETTPAAALMSGWLERFHAMGASRR
jgi:hypothetical protein